MSTASLQFVSLQQVIAAIVFIIVIYHIANRYQYGISHIPGPWIASLTDFWRVFSVYKGDSHKTDLALHGQYGPLVRLQPNLISIADPEEIQQLYGISSKFYKSRFYDPFTAQDDEGIVPDPFILNDKSQHSRMKKNGNAAYAMSSIVKMEEFADREMVKLFQIWDEHYANTGEIFDVGRWMVFYALDTVFAITYGEDFGFLEKQQDQFWMIDSMEKISDYGAIIGQIPLLHPIVANSSFLQGLALGPHFAASIAQIMSLAASQIQDFREKLETGVIDPEAPTTFAERLLTTQKLNPKSLTNRELDAHSLGNITAGGDTTSIALRAIIIQVLKSPEVHKKLLKEFESNNLSFPVSYEKASSLRYLQAVIREAMRLHPSVGLMLARTVPAGGATICGTFIPEGTDVGINPYVVQRNEKLFPLPFIFKPERWLISDQAELAAMNRAYLTFGHGPHTCSGRHISLMEISKLIPSLLMRYDMKLGSPDQEIKVKNHWFMFQKEIFIKIALRKTSNQDKHSGI